MENVVFFRDDTAESGELDAGFAQKYDGDNGYIVAATPDYLTLFHALSGVGHGNVDRLILATHGAKGELLLIRGNENQGDDVLDEVSENANKMKPKKFGQLLRPFLRPVAEVLVISCDVASGDEGKQWIVDVAEHGNCVVYGCDEHGAASTLNGLTAQVAHEGSVWVSKQGAPAAVHAEHRVGTVKRSGRGATTGRLREAKSTTHTTRGGGAVSTSGLVLTERRRKAKQVIHPATFPLGGRTVVREDYMEPKATCRYWHGGSYTQLKGTK